jgi:hypothetical protein
MIAMTPQTTRRQHQRYFGFGSAPGTGPATRTGAKGFSHRPLSSLAQDQLIRSIFTSSILGLGIKNRSTIIATTLFLGSTNVPAILKARLCIWTVGRPVDACHALLKRLPTLG